MSKTISVKQFIIFAVLVALAVVSVVALLSVRSDLKPSAAHASAQHSNHPAVSQTTETAASQPATQASNSKPLSPTDTSTPSTKPTTHPAMAETQTGLLVVRVRYDASGNACGIGPVGTCFFPYPNRLIEVQDQSGHAIQSKLSDTSGNVVYSLPGGVYRVVPGAGEEMHPFANPQEVTVASSTSNEIFIDYWAIATTNAVQF